jgi:hypothetical protein
MTEDYYRIEHQLADGSWVRISAPVYSEGDARASLKHTRAQYPERVFRLVFCTVTREVVA